MQFISLHPSPLPASGKLDSGHLAAQSFKSVANFDDYDEQQSCAGARSIEVLVFNQHAEALHPLPMDRVWCGNPSSDTGI